MQKTSNEAGQLGTIRVRMSEVPLAPNFPLTIHARPIREEVAKLADDVDSYGREKKYVRDYLRKNRTIARKHTFVQTLLRAAEQGVRTVQSFNESVQLESRLHD